MNTTMRNNNCPSPLWSTSSLVSSPSSGASTRLAMFQICLALISSSSLFNNSLVAAFSWTTTLTPHRHISRVEIPLESASAAVCIQQSSRHFSIIVKRYTPIFSSSPSSNIESTISSSINLDEYVVVDDNDNYGNNAQPSRKAPPPHWMKCINAVVPSNIRALNEAVSRIANISRSEANGLIEIGAVWARMDTLTEEDILGQYEDDTTTSSSSSLDGGGSSASIQYADFRTGWGSGDINDELYDVNSTGIASETLDDYIERQSALRYRRILTPSTIDPGTDIRIYPHPRRFPSCYEFSDPYRLLYEDTTFLVVDKPPMLPVQPEPSNYEECCPGCVNLLLGPFYTIGGEIVHRPLICHRVDLCVGGCVVLSKDGNGQRVFSDLQVCGTLALPRLSTCINSLHRYSYSSNRLYSSH